MAEKRIKRPRDPMQLAKLIGDIATGQVEDVREEKGDVSIYLFFMTDGEKWKRPLSST